MKTYEELISGPNIFEGAYFGKHYNYEGRDAIYLEKDGCDCDLHKVAVHRYVKYTDGTDKHFSSEILVHGNGFTYCDVDENGEATVPHYVTPYEIDEEKLDRLARKESRKYWDICFCDEKQKYGYESQKYINWLDTWKMGYRKAKEDYV